MQAWIQPVNPELREFVEFLHAQGAIMFGDFILKSGAHSPVFVNIFNAVKNGEGLARVGARYAARLVEFCTAREISPAHLFVFGPAYKGIELAATCARALYALGALDAVDATDFAWNVRWGYDRKEAKVTGERTGEVREAKDRVKGLVDGALQDGDNVVIVDDVLTRGDAKLEAIAKLERYAEVMDLDVTVAGILTLVDRVEGGADLRARLPVVSVLNLPTVADVLHGAGKLPRAHYDQYARYFAEKGLSRP